MEKEHLEVLLEEIDALRGRVSEALAGANADTVLAKLNGFGAFYNTADAASALGLRGATSHEISRILRDAGYNSKVIYDKDTGRRRRAWMPPMAYKENDGDPEELYL